MKLHISGSSTSIYLVSTLQIRKSVLQLDSSSSYIFHGFGPLVDSFRSPVSRSLFKCLPDSFCQLGSSISLPWVIYFEVFYLHVVSSFSCIAVICPKLVSFLTPLQFVRLFCNLSKYILSKIFGRIFDPKVTGLPSNLY